MSLNCSGSLLEKSTSSCDLLLAKDRTKPLVLVTPRTVVSWHRAGFRLYWTWVSRVKPVGGRKRVSQEMRALIFEPLHAARHGGVAYGGGLGAMPGPAVRIGLRIGGLGQDCVRPPAVRVPDAALEAALAGLDRDVRDALQVMIERTRAVHADQRRTDVTTTLGPGATVTERSIVLSARARASASAPWP